LGEALQEAFAEEGSSLQPWRLLDGMENSAVGKQLYRRRIEKDFDERNVDRLLTDTMGHIMRKWYEKRRGELTVEIARAGGDGELSDRLLREFQRLLKEERVAIGKPH
jgi:hypothetical protein